MPRERVRRLLARWRQLGTRRLLVKLFADRVFRVEDGVTLEYRHADHPVRAPANHPRFTFATVAGEAPLPPLGPYLAPRAAAFRAHLVGGATGFFVLEDGRAVGCGWLATRDHRDTDTGERFAVAPGEAYAFCWLLDPASGRLGAGLPFCRYTLATARDMGVARQYCVIDRGNRASFLIHRHFGFRESGVRVRHYRLLGARWSRTSGYSGELGLAA